MVGKGGREALCVKARADMLSFMELVEFVSYVTGAVEVKSIWTDKPTIDAFIIQFRGVKRFAF